MKQCRVCKSENLLLFLPMGSQPLANAFLKKTQDQEQSFNLDALVCLDCALIQIEDQVPKDFFRHYLYVPSFSVTMHKHFSDLAKMVAYRKIGPGYVMDIGCNDGLFLKACKSLKLPVLGVDPARNLVEGAIKEGVPVVNEYFGAKTSLSIRKEYGKASVIVSTNTISHVDDLLDFSLGVKELLEPEGTYILEIPHAGDLIEKNEFDTIYHEHLSEFSVTSIQKLLAPFEMRIFDIERLEIHGGSLRYFICHHNSVVHKEHPSVKSWLEKEKLRGLFEKDTYVSFALRVTKNKILLVKMLAGLKAEGKTIVGYGAPAKGNALLNHFGIGPEILGYLADRSSLKHGLFSPGTHIPIVPSERILADQPDYVLILAWNFAAEIIAQETEYRERGGRFIIPIPNPLIV